MTRLFGTLSSGEDVTLVELEGGGLTANVITFGASLRSLYMAGHEPSLVLGLDSVEAYETHALFFGAIVGRFANRIGGSRFSLDGADHVVDANDGANSLHGGPDGFFNRNWKLTAHDRSSCQLTLDSPDGDMGYPGNLAASCRYSLEEGGVLRIVLEAVTDRATVANIVSHCYFNLADGGAGQVSDHRLMIRADQRLEIDDTLIPTGKLEDVAGSTHDFREMRPIGDFSLFDDNFCVSDRRGPMKQVATLASPASGVTMDVETTEPGLQFYGGHFIPAGIKGLGGMEHGPGSAVCLETQNWPDAPNHSGFPDPVLRPGDILRQETVYRFRKQ